MGKPRNTQDAPAQDAPAQDAPAQDAPALSLAQLEAQRGTIKKASRTFVDVAGVPRVMLADGRIGAVQCEKRVDGTAGPALVSILRPGNGDPNAGTRWSLTDTQAVYDALYAVGVVLFTPPETPED